MNIIERIILKIKKIFIKKEKVKELEAPKEKLKSHNNDFLESLKVYRRNNKIIVKKSEGNGLGIMHGAVKYNVFGDTS